ncbi:hypothetical protein APR04_001666 [Promicromonospora umidemergens]|uniref:Excreted virulence factor EspC (Type VII ESX diderm) n=1 Tax=Promicromonospora umidemergens TaxID=629679 RepID=A0ABP8Y4H7_9MICO|nr:hypothetical protein [Promicromonospora umidemergens]MCP2282768.1 hypothetical protein [Promicromonospora umidemergens]
MGDRLLVDLNLLTETGSQLTSIVNEFEGADAYAESVADAVGDDGLANAVRDFSTKWKNRREDMREAIENLAELTSAVGEQFRDLDTELGKNLEGDA